MIDSLISDSVINSKNYGRYEVRDKRMAAT